MKPLGSYTGAQWLLRMHPDKQDTLLKLAILTMAAILCESKLHTSYRFVVHLYLSVVTFLEEANTCEK